MPNFVERQMAKGMEKSIKTAVDRQLGGNAGDDEEDENQGGDEQDEEGGGGRGRKLLRKLSGRFRRRKSGSSTSAASKSPANRLRKLFKRNKNQVVESDGQSTPVQSSDPEVVETETPILTSDGQTPSDQVTSDTDGASRAGSDWTSGGGSASDGDETKSAKPKRSEPKSDELRLLEMRPDDAVAYDARAKMDFTVRVRVVEGKELHGENLNPLVRIHLGGKTRTTRAISGTEQPRWDQTLSFNMRTSIEDLARLNCEFNVYSARRLIRDSLIGRFSMNMGIVYKSQGQAVVEKWLALMPGQDDEENNMGSGVEIRGFVKASVCVFHVNQIPPSLVARGGADDNVLYRAQLLNYCLRFRVYKLCQLADFIRFPHKDDQKAPGNVAIEISIGPYRVMSSFHSSGDGNVYIREELQIPIMWPTVIKQIRFRLILRTKRGKKRVLCTEFMNLRQLCQRGERGYLPSFGPSFISFYGPGILGNNPWKRWEANQIRNGKEPGTYFCGSVYFELLCEESKVQNTHVIDIPISIAQVADTLYHQEHYTFFCTFFAANLVHHAFKSKDIYFAVSLGQNGSEDYERVLSCTNQTLPVMPAYDTTSSYAMPWGNQKPICEILGQWEEINWRFEASNILLQIAEMISQCQTEAAMKSGSNPEQCEVASDVIYALEVAAEHFKTYRELVNRSTHATTKLDVLLYNSRLQFLDQLYDMFAELKYKGFDSEDMNESAIRQLGVFSQQIREMAADPQLSIPDVVIHMYAAGKLVGQARFSPADVYYGKSAIRCGQWCGKIRAIPLNWPSAQIAKTRGTELPCVIHLKAWFGKSRLRSQWLEQIKPATMKYYAELFYNEKRSAFSSKWAASKKNPFTISDESGGVELSESAIHPPAGWRFGGDWQPKRSHDMWVGADAGHKTFEDECFELQQKDQMTGVWKEASWTTYYGDPLDRTALKTAPRGWKYESKWTVDLHCPGDADGWQYSMTDKFWIEDMNEDGTPKDLSPLMESDIIDTEELQIHKYRRRRYKRRRRFATNSAGVTEMFEDLESFAKNLDEAGWEYAQRFGDPVHVLQQPGDRFRRRRMVRELVAVGDSNVYKLAMSVEPSKQATPQQGEESQEQSKLPMDLLSPRIYEVHDVVSTYQLRVYVLWGRELHTPKKHVSRGFVRVFFLNRCQETCVVENSMNPIWNETLLFDRLLIPGGVLALRENPPSAVVECHGEELNGQPVFLGRFTLHPTVINSPADTRSQPTWHPLRFANNKTKYVLYVVPVNKTNYRGALLMHMEMFQADPTHKKMIPTKPATKPKLGNRLEVPTDVRPKFGNYTVQIMAWGVRNLARHQMLSVRSPFIEITVADRRDTTDVIEDTGVNPNFERPLLTFSEVEMPIVLNYAPPIVLNLHDRRSFGRKPLIGTCIVKNFQRYMCSPPAQRDSEKMEAAWEAFEAENKYETKMQQKEWITVKMSEPEDYAAFPEDPNSPRIDWWSKYYYSKNENDKAPGYEKLGLERLEIFGCQLEQVGVYNYFADFLDTFVFVKPMTNALDGDPNAERRGELKGKLFISLISEQNKAIPLTPSGVEFDKPVECLVRIYIVRAFDLLGRRAHCDPYITIRCGNKKKFKGKREYVPDTVNPVFGKCIELDVTIPQEKDLVITIMDRRLLLADADNEIGSTTVDLENRLLTKHRATVGLPRQFNIIGPLPWRDHYCLKMKFPAPKILRRTDSTDVGIELVAVQFWLSEVEKKSTNNPDLVGRPLQRVALHILRQIGLVPEHIETRALYNSVNPYAECGRLEMFVDIFPKTIDERIPPAIDITPRQPKPFQLRVAVFGLRNVILQKKSMGRPAADLYVRVYLNGMSKTEKTDIHYRCLDGAASFNWRFVFDVEYDVFEKKIRAYGKKRIFRKRSAELVDPVLVIEIWDNNKFGRDRYIGQCLMDLLRFEEGQVADDEMDNVKYDKEPPLRTCCAVCIRSGRLCWRTRCCTKKQRKRDLVQMPRAPRYVPGKVGTLSLFQQRAAAGWWPCISSILPSKQKGDKKKNDETEKDDDNQGQEVEYVTGMVEMELQLLPFAEAELSPVGRKRNKPNHSPVLRKPDRPKMDSYWCTSRLKAGARICWNKSGGWSCVWITLFGFFFLLLFIAMAYQLPRVLLEKLIPF
ncbi:hypothetical protein M3Y95_00911300 [Aphelenchoides besseyi]|nr:hypothetical protein M3Y95_00911300 [Aphelenchoides besseyi]